MPVIVKPGKPKDGKSAQIEKVESYEIVVPKGTVVKITYENDE